MMRGETMNPVFEFEKALTRRERRVFRSLANPEKIQQYLDRVRYCDDDNYHCPLTVIRKNIGCCFEGALVAAVALCRIGHPPLVIEITSEGDDDHVLAVYRKNGLWGAVAKSIFPGLRSRQPVYKTLRELVMSYFEFYFNARRQRTMRGYSLPLNLRSLADSQWMLDDAAVEKVNKALDKTRHVRLFKRAAVCKLPKVDFWTFKAGMCGTSAKYLHR
jgi:hypothetical protein